LGLTWCKDGRDEKYTFFCLENLKGREQVEDVDVDGGSSEIYLKQKVCDSLN
jgi:hypothetical protein